MITGSRSKLAGTSPLPGGTLGADDQRGGALQQHPESKPGQPDDRWMVTYPRDS